MGHRGDRADHDQGAPLKTVLPDERGWFRCRRCHGRLVANKLRRSFEIAVHSFEKLVLKTNRQKLTIAK